MRDEKYCNADQWVEKELKYAPNANKDVLMFIADFLYHNGSDAENQENIRKLFHAGYCFYFANMLQIAFGRGEIVWCAPYGHIAWQDIDGQVYDVEGVSINEAEYFIPVSYMGDAIKDFMHVRKESFSASREDIQKIIHRYLSDIASAECDKQKQTKAASTINFSGLRNALEQFEDNGNYAKCGKWSIAKGGYDLWWEIYYEGYTVLQCIAGELEGGFRPIPEFTEEAELELVSKVKNVYKDLQEVKNEM